MSGPQKQKFFTRVCLFQRGSAASTTCEQQKGAQGLEPLSVTSTSHAHEGQRLMYIMSRITSCYYTEVFSEKDAILAENSIFLTGIGSSRTSES